MNIFVINKCPIKCAKHLDDRRVIKQITEGVQMLSTALYFHGVSKQNLPVKPTHWNHPANKWCRATRQNYHWLLRHTIALMHEKRRRYPENEPHLYEQYIKFLRNSMKFLPSFKRTDFVNCAANNGLGVSYKHMSDTYLAYQLYLNDRWDTDKREPTWYREKR